MPFGRAWYGGACIETGKVIETDAADRPFPSVLVAKDTPTPLHVVIALDQTAGYTYVITAYRPDSARFESDGRTRRRK